MVLIHTEQSSNPFSACVACPTTPGDSHLLKSGCWEC